MINSLEAAKEYRYRWSYSKSTLWKHGNQSQWRCFPSQWDWDEKLCIYWFLLKALLTLFHLQLVYDLWSDYWQNTYTLVHFLFSFNVIFCIVYYRAHQDTSFKCREGGLFVCLIHVMFLLCTFGLPSNFEGVTVKGVEDKTHFKHLVFRF